MVGPHERLTTRLPPPLTTFAPECMARSATHGNPETLYARATSSGLSGLTGLTGE